MDYVFVQNFILLSTTLLFMSRRAIEYRSRGAKKEEEKKPKKTTAHAKKKCWKKKLFNYRLIYLIGKAIECSCACQTSEEGFDRNANNDVWPM